MSQPPPPPPRKPIELKEGPPRMFIQQRGTRTFGPMAWETWVTTGLMRYSGEFGTYAWTRKHAERKGRRLLRSYYRRQPGPKIEVTP